MKDSSLTSETRTITEKVLGYIALVSAFPILGLIYSLGFCSVIDPDIYQLFSVSELVQFSGARSAIFVLISISMVWQSSNIIFLFNHIPNRFPEKLKSILISKKFFYSILFLIPISIFIRQRIDLDIGPSGTENWIEVISYLLHFSIGSTLTILILSALFFNRISHVAYVLCFSIWIFLLPYLAGTVEAYWTEFNSKEDPRAQRLCINKSEVQEDVIIYGENFVLTVGKRGKYNIYKTSDVSPVLIKTVSIGHRDNPCRT